jgi:transmembrane sensor
MAQILKSTEPGQKLSFHLDDGTIVILNSGSKLYYPANFDSLERKVVLDGEAFFDVSKDVDRPFRVETSSIVTTALGTSFNINAFSSAENIEVDLVHGRVSVRKIAQTNDPNTMMLNPGEMATVAKSNFSMEKSTFNFIEKISWKDGIIYFKEACYEKIVSKLENWYGVSINTNRAPLKEWKFTGQFENETLENILIALQFGHDFDYVMQKKEVKLKF